MVTLLVRDVLYGIVYLVLDWCHEALALFEEFAFVAEVLLLQVACLLFLIVVALALFGSSEIFVCLGVIVYVFSFFHARNIANTDSAEFEAIEDRFIWEEFTGKSTFHVQSKTLRKWFAGILIFLGVTMIYEYWMDIVIGFIPERLWEELYPIFEGIPATIFAIALIIAGVILIKGKKKEMNIEDIDETDRISEVADKADRISEVADKADRISEVADETESNIIKVTEEEIKDGESAEN